LLLTIPEFIGHLHPVLVHLPIGILLLACLFIWQSRKDRFAHLQPAINTILLIGMASAILSCITGYILSGTDDYDPQLLGLHQWMGISVAALSIITYYCRVRASWTRWQAPFAILLLILIFFTGHMGGSLTHGPDYLTQPLMNLTGSGSAEVQIRKPIPNVQEALAYGDLIQPLFQAKCYSCHGPKRQKGGLRLDQPALLMKGGKDGAIVVPGKDTESEIIKRLKLPEENDHHMPPREKTQVNEKEIRLLQWWIQEGADFTRKIRDLPQPDNFKATLASFQTDTGTKKPISLIPLAPVESADEKAMQKLRDRGAVVIPVSQNSHYIMVDFVSAGPVSNTDLDLLLPLKKQLAWLKLGETQISDSGLIPVGQCQEITFLDLKHTGITDRGIAKLLPLVNLQSLNLVGTAVTGAGVLSLKSLHKLRSLYLYQSAVARPDWLKITQGLPGVQLDSGGYQVPFLATDTMIVRPPKEKK
jgi:uncharacterized membrane protein